MAGFTKPQMPGAFGQTPFQGPGAIPGVPGTQQPTQVIKNVSTQTDMLKLVNSLAAQEKLSTGRALQARGQRTMDTPKHSTILGGDKSYRNILAGALESHWGRQDVQEGLQMNQQAIEDERARAQAQKEKQARMAAQAILARGGSQQEADSAYFARLAGMSADDLAGFSSSTAPAEIKPKSFEIERGGKMVTQVRDENTGRVLYEFEKAPGTNIDDLRRQWDQEANTFRDTQDAYNRMQAASQDPTGVGDLAILRGYIMMIEPNARVITEDDLRGAANSGSFGTTVSQAIEKYFGEGGLGEFRQEFLDKSEAMFTESRNRYRTAYEILSTQADGIGADPTDHFTFRPDQVLDKQEEKAGSGGGGQVRTGTATVNGQSVEVQQLPDGTKQYKDPDTGEWVNYG